MRFIRPTDRWWAYRLATLKDGHGGSDVFQNDARDHLILLGLQP